MITNPIPTSKGLINVSESPRPRVLYEQKMIKLGSYEMIRPRKEQVDDAYIFLELPNPFHAGEALQRSMLVQAKETERASDGSTTSISSKDIIEFGSATLVHLGWAPKKTSHI